jgi:hypothetical protein
MPNKCKFIFKKFSIAFLLLIASCASVNQFASLDEKYIGKFNLSQNNQSLNFGVVIFSSTENIIIQVNRPLLGNVTDVKIYPNKEVIISPQNYQFKDVFSKIDIDSIYDVLIGCLKKDRKIDEMISAKSYFKLKCEPEQNNILRFNIEVGNIYINGVLKATI